jgi:hypothetical protein
VEGRIRPDDPHGCSTCSRSLGTLKWLTRREGKARGPHYAVKTEFEGNFNLSLGHNISYRNKANQRNHLNGTDFVLKKILVSQVVNNFTAFH